MKFILKLAASLLPLICGIYAGSYLLHADSYSWWTIPTIMVVMFASIAATGILFIITLSSEK